MSDDYLTRDAGKTLVVSWTAAFEWRCVIDSSAGGTGRALENALETSGLVGGSFPGLIPESLTVNVED